MTSNIFRTTALAFVAAGLLVAAPAKAEMTKDQIEQIVRDYIANNGDQILKSVDTYQQKASKERYAEGLKNNKDALFNDEKSPFIGNAKGDVTVVEFFDYNCGYCKKVLPTINDLIKSEPNVKFVFKDLPILGPTSETAAKWALAAQKQGKYFEYHQKLMENAKPITDDVLAELAKAAGLDVAKMKVDADSSDVLLQIEKNRTLAQSMGLGGTPAFIIGDTVMPGAVGLDQMKKAVSDARAAKGAAPK